MPLRNKFAATPEMLQSVMGRHEGQRTPNSITIDDARYIVRVFPPGLFTGWVIGGSMHRFLPRTKIVSITGNDMIVSPFTAGVFVPGDVLTLITATGTAGAAVGTVAAVDMLTNKLTFTGAPTGTVGANIGDATIQPIKPNGDRLGVISPNSPVYLDTCIKYGVHLGGTFYRGLMPYLDPQLENLFPLINYV